jgi:hypothetical protein
MLEQIKAALGTADPSETQRLSERADLVRGLLAASRPSSVSIELHP